MKLPDVGEGVAEAEIVDWLVDVGDTVTPETVLAEVLTDKATVEVSSPVAGTITARMGEPGDTIAVGSHLVTIDTGGDAPPDGEPSGTDPVEADRGEPEADGSGAATGSSGTQPRPAEPTAHPPSEQASPSNGSPLPPPTSPAPGGSTRPETTGRPLAAPAVRARAKTLGIDLHSVAGTGPDGRITHGDLDRELAGGERPRPAVRREPTADTVTPQPIRGVRRQIAQRLTAAWTEIPHITYVDAVDVTELERLRAELNSEHDGTRVRLTLLPFLARSIVIAVRDQPRLNAHYDHAAETLGVADAVHVGIATQTDDGLRVPVVRHAESLGLWALAEEIGQVSSAARDGRASRDQLSGSTITITSLGALGGIVTTPILNAPEVAIVGVNKIEVRPVWVDGSFQPRQMMNLSSSFDHRIVDGWDAATFVQRLKALLETPARLFIDE